MDDMQLVELIRDAESPEALKKAADRIAAEILEAPGAIVHAWASGKPAESDKAGMVLLDLGVLPVQPMLAESQEESATVNSRFLLLTQAVEIHLGVRAHLFRRLDKLLDDEKALAPEEAESGWAELPPMRVCDKAYLWIHRLLRVDNTPGTGFLVETDFARLTQVERDREIHRWRRSIFWGILRRGE